jgi:SOS-response transcriptional repressor LexA
VQDTDMVNGSELSPTSPPGTIIIIDPNKEYKIRDCVIATRKLSGAVLFRRVMKYGIDLILEPLSARDKFYEIEEFYIIGVVVAGINLNLWRRI